MIISDETILSKFKTENFKNLTIEERRTLVIDFVNSIIKERGLSPVEIEFSSKGFAYNPKRNTIYIWEDALTGELKNSNFILLQGIIHELRHKEQNNENYLFYSGKAYLSSPQEIDAHEYTSSELVNLSNFIDENEFDKFVYISMSNDAMDINYATNYFLLCGYSKEEVPDVCQRQTLYISNFWTEPEDEKQEYFFADNQLYDFDSLSFSEKIRLQDSPIIAKFPQKGIVAVRVNGFSMYIKEDKIFMHKMGAFEDISGEEFLTKLHEALNFISQNFQQIGINKISIVNFPPLEFIDVKEQKDKIFEFLNIENGTTTLESILGINVDDDSIKSLTITKKIGTETVPYLKSIFGIDYQSKYSKEQQIFLESMIPYIEDCEQERMLPSGEENNGYFAIESYKPEFSVKKLELILAAQKEGLNTMYYDDLSEDQIKELMKEQRKGISREEIKRMLAGFNNPKKPIDSIGE